MKQNQPPFSVIVGKDGCYTPEYTEWATKRENYPGSSLQIDDLGGHGNSRTIHNTTYVDTYPIESRKKAEADAKRIREMGGLAVVRSCMRKKKEYYMVWFNPNGSKEARVYVSGW